MVEYAIHLEKQNFKFSAAHFLIFPDGTAEQLHGHNYRVYGDIEGDLGEAGVVLDFGEVKPIIRQICDDLDEKLLLPQLHPTLQIKPNGKQIHVIYREKEYSIPKEDVAILPITNSSAEQFATYICKRLKDELIKKFGNLPNIRRIKIGVEETPGQSGVYTEIFE